jgi:hypothetical protein
MIAGVYRINCDQGATFERTMTIYNPSVGGASATPVNLTGYSARMQVRPETDSNEIMVELTTENGRLTLGGVAGTIEMEIEADVTETFDTDGVYDLEIYNNAGKVYRVIKGRFVVEPEVTRDAE